MTLHTKLTHEKACKAHQETDTMSDVLTLDWHIVNLSIAMAVSTAIWAA